MRTLHLVPIIAMVGYGVWGLATHLFHSKPLTMTCADYLDSSPNTLHHLGGDRNSSPFKSNDWLELTNCELDVGGLIYAKSPFLGKVEKVFIPVRPESSSQDDTTRLYIRCTSADDIHLANELQKFSPSGSTPLTPEALHTMKERASQRIVRGMVSHDMGLIEGIKLDAAGNHSALGIVIIEEGKRPSALPPLCSLIAGIALMLIIFFRSPSGEAPSGCAMPPPLTKPNPPPLPKE